MKRFALALGFTAMLVLGGVAYGTIPDRGGVIHSCYSQATGTWRPIDTETSPTQKCKSGEKLLDWNQQGVKGDTGATGRDRTAGPEGRHRRDGRDRTARPERRHRGTGPQGRHRCRRAAGACRPEGRHRRDRSAGTSGRTRPAWSCGTGVSGYHVVIASSDVNGDVDHKFAYAECREGEQILGGGGTLDFVNNPFTNPHLALTDSFPAPVPGGDHSFRRWWASATEITPTDTDWGITAYAICANIAP